MCIELACRSFDKYANTVYGGELTSEETRSKEESIQILKVMGWILTEGIGHIQSDYLTRTKEWIMSFKKKTCIELPDLCHMASYESIVEKIKAGFVRVSSQAIPGAWFSSDVEVKYGDYGLLIDVKHAPEGGFNLISQNNGYSIEREWIGFQRPFNFRKNHALHIAGIVVPDLKNISQIRTACNIGEADMPDHCFVTQQEARLRCCLMSKARSIIYKGPLAKISNHLQEHGRVSRYPFIGRLLVVAIVFIALVVLGGYVHLKDQPNI